VQPFDITGLERVNTAGIKQCTTNVLLYVSFSVCLYYCTLIHYCYTGILSCLYIAWWSTVQCIEIFVHHAIEWVILLVSGAQFRSPQFRDSLRPRELNRGNPCKKRVPATTRKRCQIEYKLPYWLIGSRIRAFDRHQNRRPWMTVNGPETVITCCFSQNASFRKQLRQMHWTYRFIILSVLSAPCSVFLCLIFRAFAFYVLCLFLIATSFLVNNGEYINIIMSATKCRQGSL